MPISLFKLHAPANTVLLSFTLNVSQVELFELNAVTQSNIHHMSRALETFQVPISRSKVDALENMERMFVIFDVSHPDRSLLYSLALANR